MNEAVLKVVIVGHDLTSKCQVGNILLGSVNFKPMQCSKGVVKPVKSDTVQGRLLHICMTPNLSTPRWCDVRSRYKKVMNSVFLYVHNCQVETVDENAGDLKSYFGPEMRLCRVIYGDIETATTNTVNDDEDMVLISGEEKERSSERKKLFSTILDLLQKEVPKRLPPKDTPKKDEVDDKGAEGDAGLGRPTENNETDKEIIESVKLGNNRSSTPSIPCRELTSKDWELYSKTLRRGYAPSKHFRVNIVGHQCVGKTTLLHRLQDLTTPVPIDCTKGLDVKKITSKCIEKDGKRIWESQIDGYEKELNIQRMASAMKECSNTRKEELVDRETTDPGPEILDDGLSAVKRLDTTVEFGSDSIDDLDVQQIPAPLQTPSNGASKIINNAEKASYLQQVVRCLEHSSGERLYTSFWDFAGQSGYYSTHQAFLSPASVYILVVSLQKEINEVIEDNIDFNLDASQRKKMTVFDTMKFWMDSIRTYTTDTNGAHAPVILVGTHKDKVTEERAKETLRSICKRLDIPVFIAIDNTTDSTNDPYLEDLKSLIIERGLGIIEPEIPAQWINLERVIMTEQDKGTSLLTFDEFRQMDLETDVPFNDDKLLREFLTHEHIHGCLMYFDSQGLENIIILDPMILVLFLNLLLEKRPDDREVLYERVSQSGFCRDGIFDKKYVEDLSVEMSQYGIVHKHIKKLLKIIVHLGIAFPLPKTHKTFSSEYFMPSLLQEMPVEKAEQIKTIPQAAPTIVIDFGRTCIPPSIFHRLVAKCLWNNFEPDKEDDSIQIYNGLARFNLTKDKMEWFQLMWKKFQIHISVFDFCDKRPVQKMKCNEALEKIVLILEEIIEIYRHEVVYEINVVCPTHCDPPGLIPVADLIASEHGQSLCRKGQHPHPVKREEMLPVWYPQEVENEAAQRLYEKPSDRLLGRLAMKIPSEPLGLACSLKFMNPSDIAKEAEHDHKNNGQWQLLEILLRWRKLNPGATVHRLRKCLTKQNWCTELCFDAAINLSPPTTLSASQYGVPDEVLRRQPCQREIALFCDSVGVNYVFLFLELGLDYVTIEQERDNYFGKLTNLIMTLLFKWQQIGGCMANYRQLFDCAQVVGLDVNKIIERLRPSWK